MKEDSNVTGKNEVSEQEESPIKHISFVYEEECID
jgi:hypothetical protein